MSPASLLGKVQRESQQLPDHLRGSVVLLRFAEPIPRHAVYHFVRIRLTEAMKADGEESHYRVHSVQPHRAGQRPCVLCGVPRKQISENEQVCENGLCRNYGTPVSCGPLRGVLKMLISPDFEEEGGRLNRVGLILDRRYNDETLAGVYRAAGMLCDQLGWSLV